ncbi:MAG: hypothetical protein Q4D55_03445 [Eubacteriales bacterium]|nr:hypothetical protein [Eubacteriales bacterium]
MQEWILDYYVGEGIRDPERIRDRIDRGKLAVGVYLVTLSHNPGNLLEVVPAVLLVQKPLARLCPAIVGMAKGKEAAIELASSIVKDVYQATGAFQVKEFLENR